MHQRTSDASYRPKTSLGLKDRKVDLKPSVETSRRHKESRLARELVSLLLGKSIGYVFHSVFRKFHLKTLHLCFNVFRFLRTLRVYLKIVRHNSEYKYLIMTSTNYSLCNVESLTPHCVQTYVWIFLSGQCARIMRASRKFSRGRGGGGGGGGGRISRPGVDQQILQLQKPIFWKIEGRTEPPYPSRYFHEDGS